MKLKPTVCIVCICYNQEKYIAQAIDSFLMQKKDTFDLQIIISDDASTDNTQNIIKSYLDSHKNITTIFRNVNTGGEENYLNALSLAKSTYVIYCEGDDYFSDPLKLEKQVAFLEKNLDFSICFHPVDIIYEDKSKEKVVFPDKEYLFNKTVLTIDDLLIHNFIQTNSALYRWRFVDKKINIPKGILPMDYYLHLLHAEVGKIGFLKNIMSVYRKHAQGIWWGVGVSEDWFLKNGFKHANFYLEIIKNFNITKERQTLFINAINDLIKNTLAIIIKSTTTTLSASNYEVKKERSVKLLGISVLKKISKGDKIKIKLLGIPLLKITNNPNIIKITLLGFSFAFK
jgi:glycosyltransferase involved in cell wall biosynthesis